MARLPFLEEDDLLPEDRMLLERPINLNKILAHSPGAARAFGRLGGYIRHKSPLDPRLRELAILQVGWLARSPYEWSHHVKIGQDFGVSEADIHGLIADSSGAASDLGTLERTVLRGAREIYDDLAMGEQTYDALRDALGETCLVDLVLTIAFYCAVVRFLATFEMDVEPDYQPYLDAFPLPE